MSIRKVFSIKYLVFSILFLTLFLHPIVASAQESDIPEKNGTYKVPGHDNMRVRVFVHQAPTKSPALISCEQDVNSGPQDGVTGWHLPSQVTYLLNSGSAPSSYLSTNLNTIASKAFSTWQSPLSGKVTFTPGGTTSLTRKTLDYQNIIAWGRTSGSALAVTYTWYYTDTHEVADTDTIFNKKFTWGWSTNTCDSSYYDAQDILTHELGHWVGLDDEYDQSYANNTMFGYGSKGEIKKDTLTTGDTIPLTTLY